MSRVDDAMRRASGAVLTDQPAPVPEVPSAVPAADLAELSSEPFPEEETPAAAAAPAGSDGAPPERPHLVAAPAQVTNTADPLRPHKISSENAPVFQRISAGMKRKLVIDTSMAPGSR